MAKTITITSKKAGFHRAGRPWPETPVTVDEGEFSAAQLAALRSEPMLIVHDGAAPMTTNRIVELERNLAAASTRIVELERNLAAASARIVELETELADIQKASDGPSGKGGEGKKGGKG
ncbi:MAG: HI1506-related protein [Nitrospirota bacterium]|nr:HI1506-related protein [Nitrospirota bacterium]